MVAPPGATAAATSLDSSQENTHEKLDRHGSGVPSSVSPLAASTTLPHDSTRVNRNMGDDEAGSEPENDEKDDSALPKTAKIKIGTFVIKEFDNASCVGVVHRVVYAQNTFRYSVLFSEVGLEESFDEDEMMKYVFVHGDWIVMKDLDVFVMEGKTEHPAKIDSLVRLAYDSMDTKLLRVRQSNNFKQVVEIKYVKPMHSSGNRQSEKRKNEDSHCWVQLRMYPVPGSC